MSLVRPGLGRLRTALAQRALSSSVPASAVPSSSTPSSPSSSAPSDNARRDPRLAPRIRDLTGADRHTPIVFRTPVPRSPDYPTKFADAPLHEHINYPFKMFETPHRAEWPEIAGEAADPTAAIAAITGLSTWEVRSLSNYKIIIKRVSNMTKKGKQPSFFAMAVVGSPEKGLVGIGRGRGQNAAVASSKASSKAALSMDYVDRFENRTVWGQGADLKCKFGATTVFMRARPPGFGLQVPHVLHRVLSACGIRDASATIEGSRNPMNVMNAAIQILHGGFGPPGLGSGKGTSGRKQDKGAGMRSIRDIERQRGRFGVDLGRQV